MLAKERIAAIVETELNNARGYNSDVLGSKRAEALEYYQGQLPAAPAAETTSTGEIVQIRSGIVSMDVADCLHSLMAQIQPIVKTTSIEFEAESEQDEASAQAESDLVRKVIERNGGFAAVFSGCHDSFMSGNGWLCIETEEVEETIEKCFPPNLTAEQIAFLQEPQSEGETRRIEQEDDETCVYITTKTEQIKFRPVPPEDLYYTGLNGIGSVQELRFIAEKRLFTASQLRKMGIKQSVIDLLPDAPSPDSVGDEARLGEMAYSGSNAQSAQDAERLKVVYCCHLMLDAKENGKSSLYSIWYSGSEVIYQEPAAYIPYVTGSAIPVPHRLEGLSLYDLLKAIQDGKSHVLRNFMDNLSAMNQSRIGAVEGQVNMSDLTNGRINGIVRMRRPDALVPLPAADIGMQAMNGLNYLDQVRTQRVGSALDFNEAQAQLMGSSATAAAGQLAKVEQMAGWFADNLVNTMLKAAFAMVHRVLREEVNQPLSAKLRGQWIQMDPSQWPPRKNIVTTLGMTSLERAARVQALTGVLTQQQTILMNGGDGILCDFSRYYNAMSDWIRANNLGDPDSYIIDPSSQGSQQALQQQQQAQQASQEQMVQMQVQMQKMQNDFELEKQQRDLDYKEWSDRLSAQIEQMKLHNDSMIQADKDQTTREVAALGFIESGRKNQAG